MEPFIGQIICVGFSFAPPGWAMCNGQLLNIAQNQALYSLLGTTYGGDGRVTFALPDLRGRAPIGMGQGPGLSSRVIGEKGGTEAVTANGTTQFALKADNLPSHKHTITGEVQVGVADQDGSTAVAPGNVLGSRALETVTTPPTRIEVYVPATSAAFTKDNKLGAVSHNLAVSNTGAGMPVTAQAVVNVPIVQPFLGMNYLICMEGIYPPRP
jgi:microcystin-dependent protein